jgi:hypothetical protein
VEIPCKATNIVESAAAAERIQERKGEEKTK